MGSSWLVALRPDGIALFVDGGAPAEWVGKSVTDGEAFPAEVVREAHELLLDARTSPADAWLFRRKVAGEGERPDVELLLVEAVPLRREATPLGELLTRTMETLLEQARAIEVDLKVEADEGMPATLPIDGEKIAWGVAALVGSALRHVTGPGGAPVRDKRVEVVARYDEEAREVVLTVSDNGPGIPRGKLEWLTTRDPRTQRAAGLALVLLRDVVAAHGGRMDVESSTQAKGHGTRVTLHLPTV
jgi:signal transduction histidine kinase